MGSCPVLVGTQLVSICAILLHAEAWGPHSCTQAQAETIAKGPAGVLRRALPHGTPEAHGSEQRQTRAVGAKKREEAQLEPPASPVNAQGVASALQERGNTAQAKHNKRAGL